MALTEQAPKSARMILNDKVAESLENGGAAVELTSTELMAIVAERQVYTKVMRELPDIAFYLKDYVYLLRSLGKDRP